MGRRSASTLQYFMATSRVYPRDGPRRVITAQKWPSELHVGAVFKPWRDTWPSDVFKICFKICMKKQVILEDFLQPVASLAGIPL